MAVRTPLILDNDEVREMSSSEIQAFVNKVEWLWGQDEYRPVNVSRQLDGIGGNLNAMYDTRDSAGAWATNTTSTDGNTPEDIGDGVDIHATWNRLNQSVSSVGTNIYELTKDYFYYLDSDGSGTIDSFRPMSDDDMIDTFVKPAIDQIVVAGTGPGKYTISTLQNVTDHKAISDGNPIFVDTVVTSTTDTSANANPTLSYYLHVGDSTLEIEPTVTEPFSPRAFRGPTGFEHPTSSEWIADAVNARYKAASDWDNTGVFFNEYDDFAYSTGAAGYSGTTFAPVTSGTGSGSTGGFDLSGLNATLGYSEQNANNKYLRSYWRTGSTGSVQYLYFPKFHLKYLKSVSFYAIAGSNSNGGETPDAGEELQLKYKVGSSTYLAVEVSRSTTSWTKKTWNVSDVDRARFPSTSSSNPLLFFQQQKTASSSNVYDHYGITHIELEFLIDVDGMLGSLLRYVSANTTGYRIRYQTQNHNETLVGYQMGSTILDKTRTTAGQLRVDYAAGEAGNPFSGDVYASRNVPDTGIETENRYSLRIYKT